MGEGGVGAAVAVGCGGARGGYGGATAVVCGVAGLGAGFCAAACGAQAVEEGGGGLQSLCFL